MLQPKRVDAAQREIVAALRAAGAKVQSIASVGRGCPDLLVAHAGRWYVMEVKTPGRARWTASERAWHKEFGAVAPVHVVGSAQEALAVLQEEV